jgi:transposase
VARIEIERWLKVFSALDEAQRRWFAAQKALELGWGGISRVSEWTGMSDRTIRTGIGELELKQDLPIERVRRAGAGRPRIERKDEELVRALEEIIGASTAGDPMSELRWTTRTTRSMAEELNGRGYAVGYRTVGRVLHDLGYSLQANQKNKEGRNHPERNRQFKYINRMVKDFMASSDPVISVDTKKKENVGEFKNAGRLWRKKGKANQVNVYDFPSLGVGKAVPYGVYDAQRNQGMVNVGTSADTGEFAVESIRQWWRRFGRRHYSETSRLLICADAGGSNAATNKGWKVHLQQLADQSGLQITVCHYPTGTSKWNKIEHRMFSYIRLHWKGEPLVSFETVVNLIASTTTKTGLRVAARLDSKAYEKGITYTNDQLNTLNLTRHRARPKWNYTISPTS